jgi:hypothetical protein
MTAAAEDPPAEDEACPAWLCGVGARGQPVRQRRRVIRLAPDPPRAHLGGRLGLFLGGLELALQILNLFRVPDDRICWGDEISTSKS